MEIQCDGHWLLSDLSLLYDSSSCNNFFYRSVTLSALTNLWPITGIYFGAQFLSALSVTFLANDVILISYQLIHHRLPGLFVYFLFVLSAFPFLYTSCSFYWNCIKVTIIDTRPSKTWTKSTSYHQGWPIHLDSGKRKLPCQHQKLRSLASSRGTWKGRSPWPKLP